MGDTSDFIRIYNWEGIAEDVPACPPAESDWTTASSDGPGIRDRGDHQPLLKEIEALFHHRVVRWKMLALNAKLILQVELDDGSTMVARKLMNKDHLLRFQFIKNENDIQSLLEILHNEARLLRWLAKAITLPIPRVLYPLDTNHNGDVDFMLQTMLPGEILLNSWSKLSAGAKNRVVEQFAHASVQLFRLYVPQKIGSILASDDAHQPHDIKPPYHVSFAAPRTFDDILEYAEYLIDARKTAMATLGGDNGHLDALRGHIKALVAEIQSLNSSEDMSALLRCVLVHADLSNEQNVLVTAEGDITGILDWEYHLVHPALIGVEYPPWLLYDGSWAPVAVQGAALEHSYLDTPEESAGLRELYRGIVKGLDAEYHNALVQGEKLRACTRWLFTNAASVHDTGCGRLKRWMDSVFA